MSYSQLALRLAIEPLRTLAFGSITSSYAGVGTSLAYPSRKLLFQNYTDVLVTFSDDGVNDKFVLASNTSFVLDEGITSYGDYTAAGTRFYAKTAGSPSLGGVYISTWYGAS